MLVARSCRRGCARKGGVVGRAAFPRVLRSLNLTRRSGTSGGKAKSLSPRRFEVSAALGGKWKALHDVEERNLAQLREHFFQRGGRLVQAFPLGVAHLGFQNGDRPVTSDLSWERQRDVGNS